MLWKQHNETTTQKADLSLQPKTQQDQWFAKNKNIHILHRI